MTDRTFAQHCEDVLASVEELNARLEVEGHNLDAAGRAALGARVDQLLARLRDVRDPQWWLRDLAGRLLRDTCDRLQGGGP